MKKTIAVIFGWQSAEHDVSIITAHTPIIQSLLATGQFEVIPVYIAHDSSWYSDPQMIDLDYFRSGLWEKLSKLAKLQILFENGLTLVWPGFFSRETKIDVVFPSMHGTLGEDGSLMGLLRMAQVPFVGCDLFASAVAMDKVLTKQVLAAEGVPTVPFVWFTKHDWKTESTVLLKRIAELRYPLFVKPVHLGSSIGITKVKDVSSLENAIEVAFYYDDKVLVEEGVEHLIEVTLPILGNEDLQLAAIERPMNKTEFFDFDDKYLSGGKKGAGVANQYSEIPAQIDPNLAKQVQELGRKTYRVLGCSGTTRVDFLIEGETKKVYVNEVNTLPGSLYAHNWRKIGISGVELVTRLVALAEERFAQKQEIIHEFASSILDKVAGPKLGG